MKRIKLVNQTEDNECGLCCLSMLMSSFGKNEPIAFYRDLYNTGRDGLTVVDLYKLLVELGISPKAYQSEKVNELPINNNKYIFLINGTHYIYGIVRKNNIQIFDPAKGAYSCDFVDFEKMYSGVAITGEPNENFIKNNRKISDFTYIFQTIHELWGPIFQLILISSVVALLTLSIPLELRSIVDDIIANDSENLFEIANRLILFGILFFLLSFLKIQISISLQKKLYSKIYRKVINKLFKIKYSFFDNRSSSNLLFRLSILTSIQDMISGNLIDFLVSSIALITIMGYLFFVYPKLILLIFCLIALVSLVAYRSGNKIIKQKKIELNKKDKNDSLVNEITINMYHVRTLNSKKFFYHQFENVFGDYLSNFEKTQIVLQLSNMVMVGISIFIPIICVLFLSSKYTPYSISIGSLFSLYSIFNMLFSQVVTLINNLLAIQMIKTSLFYVNDILDESDEKNYRKKLVDSFEEMRIEHLCFSYNAQNKRVLDNINLQIKPGEKVSIIGKSGSGKTSLMKLITRLYTPTSGEITINGQNIQSLENESLSNLMSVVPQQTVFFNKSIIENLTLGDETISKNDVLNGLKLANILNEVNALPMGLNTVLSSQGGNLSGGQLQRLSIARALVKNPKLLIMDEATSSLDKDNEEAIFKNLKEKKIAVLSISHSVSTVKDSDKIVCLLDGKIKENGTHAELVENKGYYYSLSK